MEFRATDMPEQDPLTFRIIGEATRVHCELGPGLDEVCEPLRAAANLRGT